MFLFQTGQHCHQFRRHIKERSIAQPKDSDWGGAGKSPTEALSIILAVFQLLHRRQTGDSFLSQKLLP